MRNIFKIFGVAFMTMCSTLFCSCDKHSDDDVFYADIEDSGIVTTHDKEINKEYECSEFYINGLCYENTKLIIGTADIDDEYNPFYFWVKLNENGDVVYSQTFRHYGKIFDTKNSIARFDIRINDIGSIGKIVLYKSGNKWIGTYED